MLGTISLSVAILAYTFATYLMLRSIRSASEQASRTRARISLMIAFAGLAAHCTYIALVLFQNGILDFSLSSMAVMTSGILVLIFLLGCFGLQIERLGVLVFPLTGISLLFSVLWLGEETRLSEQSLLPLSSFSSHVLVAILAYSLLTIATVQALLYAYQEKQFKNRTAPTMMASLPPLQTMEKLLFRLTVMGFVLLTLTLISGALFSQQIFGKPFDFNHHTVLAVLGWLAFATLLVKRIKSGLRGAQAAVWTVAGFLLIQLGYFGTKFVSESLNL